MLLFRLTTFEPCAYDCAWPKNSTGKLSISMPPRMVKKVQSAAARRDMTTSELIRVCVREWLENQTATK